ncbi:MAG: hypothetical protein OWU84_03525 [Firmicutes bacterium]|nr:hypothetical protein [Bacillota bacterium]
MIRQPSLRRVAALVVFAAVVWASTGPAHLMQRAATQALALWWDHYVPIMLMGYVAARLILWLVPTPPLGMLALVAYCTFPPVAAIAALDHQRTANAPEPPPAPLLLYTNFYNPLLFPDPRAIFALDLFALTAALWLYPPGRWKRMRLAAVPFGPRQWITEAFDWTSLTGITALSALVVHQGLPSLPLGWLLEPVALYWHSRPRLGWTPAFWTMLGGLPYWALFAKDFPAPKNTWVKLGALRLAQALWAATLFTCYCLFNRS